MGTIKQLHCKDCGTEWDMFTGSGMSSRILSCNSCNKQYKIDNPVPSDTDPKVCECGGKLSLEPDNFVCPECKGRNIKSEDVGLWD